MEYLYQRSYRRNRKGRIEKTDIEKADIEKVE